MRFHACILRTSPLPLIRHMRNRPLHVHKPANLNPILANRLALRPNPIHVEPHKPLHRVPHVPDHVLRAHAGAALGLSLHHKAAAAARHGRGPEAHAVRRPEEEASGPVLCREAVGYAEAVFRGRAELGCLVGKGRCRAF